MPVYLNFLPDLQIYTKWKQYDDSAECFTISNNSVNHSGYCKVQQNLVPRLQTVDEFFLIKAFKRPHNTFLSKKHTAAKVSLTRYQILPIILLYFYSISEEPA